MSILARSTIPLIADQLKMFNTVTLSAFTAHEVLHRASSSYQMEIVLAQIAQGEGREAEWARRTLAGINEGRPKLKFPDRLAKIEVT